MKNNKMNLYFHEDAVIEKTDDYIIVDISKMKTGTNQRVDVQCDYCGKILNVKFNDYKRVMDRNLIGKYACRSCGGKKCKETMNIKYGVDNCSQLDDVKNKKIKTCKKNYNCDYPMQSKLVKDKTRCSMKNKYGVEHNFHRKEIVDKVKYQNSHLRFKNGNIISSKAQRHICEICNGILNYPVEYYNLDILLSDNVYIEYNGSGHDLNIRMGQISEKDFLRKEIARYNKLKNLGYKEIIIDNLSDKLPDDEIIIDIIKGLKEFLLKSDSNWIRINLDNMKIKTKHCEIFYVIN